MNTQNNKPRFTIDNGLVAFIPLPKGKGLTITATRDADSIRDMFSIRSRAGALYDYADHGLKNYDLLVALVASEKAA